MVIKQESLTSEIEKILINFSKEWEEENSCYGYMTNSSSDFEERIILIAYDENLPIGYLFGIFDTNEKEYATMPKNSQTFELEEIYIKKSYRSKGVGRALFLYLEEMIKDKVDYITLSTATKNYKSILHFYIDELEMNFWNARLFKKMKK